MKTVICPGSFDPITNGHLDIIRRSSKLFDKVIVVVMKNPSKTNFCFSPEERAELIKSCTQDLPNVEVDIHAGLLAEYAKEKNINCIFTGAINDREELRYYYTASNLFLFPSLYDTINRPSSQSFLASFPLESLLFHTRFISSARQARPRAVYWCKTIHRRRAYGLQGCAV